MNLKIIELNSFSEIQTECNKLAQSSDSVFFRGTKVNSLFPSIVPNNNRLNPQRLKRIEEKLFTIFKLICTEKVSNQDEITADWLYRIKSREYGLCSRLMDWSNTFYKALDFATYGNSSGTHVYLWILSLDSKDLVFTTDLKNHPFKKLSSSFMIRNAMNYQNPVLSTSRQFVQGGNFLVQPSEFITTPVEKQPLFQERLICLKIPSEKTSEIRADIKKIAGEDVDQSILIDGNNCIDSVCSTLNHNLLYSKNS